MCLQLFFFVRPIDLESSGRFVRSSAEGKSGQWAGSWPGWPQLHQRDTLLRTGNKGQVVRPCQQQDGCYGTPEPPTGEGQPSHHLWMGKTFNLECVYFCGNTINWNKSHGLWLDNIKLLIIISYNILSLHVKWETVLPCKAAEFWIDFN